MCTYMRVRVCVCNIAKLRNTALLQLRVCVCVCGGDVCMCVCVCTCVPVCIYSSVYRCIHTSVNSCVYNVHGCIGVYSCEIIYQNTGCLKIWDTIFKFI